MKISNFIGKKQFLIRHLTDSHKVRLGTHYVIFTHKNTTYMDSCALKIKNEEKLSQRITKYEKKKKKPAVVAVGFLFCFALILFSSTLVWRNTSQRTLKKLHFTLLEKSHFLFLRSSCHFKWIVIFSRIFFTPTSQTENVFKEPKRNSYTS